MAGGVTFLPGYKTYVLAGVAAVGAFMQAMGWISREHWETLVDILTPLALITLRAAITKVEQP